MTTSGPKPPFDEDRRRELLATLRELRDGMQNLALTIQDLKESLDLVNVMSAHDQVVDVINRVKNVSVKKFN